MAGQNVFFRSDLHFNPSICANLIFFNAVQFSHKCWRLFLLSLMAHPTENIDVWISKLTSSKSRSFSNHRSNLFPLVCCLQNLDFVKHDWLIRLFFISQLIFIKFVDFACVMEFVVLSIVASQGIKLAINNQASVAWSGETHVWML